MVAPAQAEPVAAEPATGSFSANEADTVMQGLDDVERAALEAEQLFNVQKKKIEELQRQLEERQILQGKSDEERKVLAESMDSQLEALNALINNWKEYKGNVHALQAEAKARKYLPWGYAAAALLLFKKDTVQDKALVGLAGYGTGSLIEQSNWGLSHLGVKTLFKFGYEF